MLELIVKVNTDYRQLTLMINLVFILRKSVNTFRQMSQPSKPLSC